MKRILIVGLVALLPFGGCAEIQRLESAVSTLTSGSVSPQAVVIAVNSFDAVEASATNYLRLQKCNGANGPVCRDPAVTVKVVLAIRQGRVARDNLLLFSKTHPGQLGSQGLYDAVQTAIATIDSILSTH